MGVLCVGLGIVAIFGAYYYVAPELPDIEALKEVKLQVPLRVYSRDGLLLAEFGEKRRVPLKYEQIPKSLEQAFIAAEDDRFYQHPGVDYQGLMRAAWTLAATGERRQGGSTITMQVARNFFLSREKTYTRKLSEIFLALKIEKALTKPQILELYLNKIYLGQRAYGVGAAAQVYYGRSVDELDLAQIAMIAGLPKAPSKTNPVTDPQRALGRRQYVLDRMLQLAYIDRKQHEAATQQPVTAELHAVPVDLDAPYVAEMVRSGLTQRYGEDAYTLGLHVTTTVDGQLQAVAQRALREALLAYDRRHGWRGAEAHLDLETSSAADRQARLKEVGTVGGLEPVIVTAVEKQAADVQFVDGRVGRLEWEAISWAHPYVSENRRGKAPKQASDVLEIGDVVRVRLDEESLGLYQIPGVQGAFVALDPRDGSILALAGGFDFFASKFNRAVQAERQPGSGFKPFLYTAALEHGYTPATLINDAPIVLEDASLEGDWRPQNYSRKFYGPTRMREALYKSRNLVSIRLLRDVGIEYVRDYARRFGFESDRLPKNLSLALGSGTMKPIEMAVGFATFANGGYRVESHLIGEINGPDGENLYSADYPVVPALLSADTRNDRPLAERVLSEEVAYLIRTMLRDVVRRGTARKAQSLGRDDLGGKTGTTNDQIDAWFNGFNDQVVATAWVGFDKLQPLGRKEVGGVAALPMWIRFMETALEGLPEAEFKQPEGIVTARIDVKSGQRVSEGSTGAGTMLEYFRVDDLAAQPLSQTTLTDEPRGDAEQDSLF
jgi:penicillin-binding protein 1A